MKITERFIQRPVLAIVVNLIIIIVGLRAVSLMPIRQYPAISAATIKITTNYPGASAGTVRDFITSPLERQVASAEDIDYLRSTSIQDQSIIEAHLKLNANYHDALGQITARVNAIRSQLPAATESPIVDVERADDHRALLYLAFQSNSLSQIQLADYLARTIQPDLQTIAGVQRVQMLGARQLSVRIWMDPKKLAGFGLSSHDVESTLLKNNHLSAIGHTNGTSTFINLRANTDVRDLEGLQQLPLIAKDGAIVRLEEVAKVEIGVENYDAETRFNQHNATYLAVFQTPSSNSLAVSRIVKERLEQLRAGMPSGIEINIADDSSAYIGDALKEIGKTLSETLLIVALVIYVIMGSLRSVLIPLVAIPISICGAVLLAYLFGFSINLLTILAVILSIGLVVDDAIVVAENVNRHIEEGMSPVAAALHSMRELGGPIIAITITLAAVYSPIALQGGLTGILFREFALTLASAVLVSGFVALTLSPMMSTKLLGQNNAASRIHHYVNAKFILTRETYVRFLTRIISAPREMMVITVTAILLILPFYFFSQKELAPAEDQGRIYVYMTGPANSTVEYSDTYAREVEKIWAADPDTQYFWQYTERTVSNTGITLKPWHERHRSINQLMSEMYFRLRSISGMTALPAVPSTLPSGSDFDVEMMVVADDDPARMTEYIGQIMNKAMGSGLFLYADTSLKYDLPQVEIQFDRDKIAALGIDMESVGEALSTFLGGAYVNHVGLNGQSYKVIPQLARKDQLDPEQLTSIYINGPKNEQIPLSSIASLHESIVPRTLERFQQRNAAAIFAGLLPGVTSDTALAFLEKSAREVLPPGYSLDYAGQSRQLRSEGNSLNITLLFAVAIIYLVLAALFGNFRSPLIILLGSAPLAICGALLFSFFGLTTINIYSQIGLITLVGLVAKNGILIVQFANQRQAQGCEKKAAILEAAQYRLRPIIVTSAATVLGHFPLILASGAGAAARHSIGIVLVAGMTIGTLFTLLIVPSLYMLISPPSEMRNKTIGFESAPDSLTGNASI